MDLDPPLSFPGRIMLALAHRWSWRDISGPQPLLLGGDKEEEEEEEEEEVMVRLVLVLVLGGPDMRLGGPTL